MSLLYTRCLAQVMSCSCRVLRSSKSLTSCCWIRKLHSCSRGMPLKPPVHPSVCAGLPADGTITAEVAFMFNEWYQPNCQLDFPRGGSQAIIKALVRSGLWTSCCRCAHTHSLQLCTVASHGRISRAQVPAQQQQSDMMAGTQQGPQEAWRADCAQGSCGQHRDLWGACNWRAPCQRAAYQGKHSPTHAHSAPLRLFTRREASQAQVLDQVWWLAHPPVHQLSSSHVQLKSRMTS